MIKIGIVGVGAVGVSLLSQLFQCLKDKKIQQTVEIYLFEKSTHIAKGLAYQDDSLSNVLNRPANKMSINYDSELDFSAWLAKNQLKIKNIYPDLVLDEKDPYWPRPVFGLYLKDVFNQTLRNFHRIGVAVHVLSEEVIDIQFSGSFYEINTATGKKLSCFKQVVLSTGHSEDQKFSYLKQVDAFFNSPYPTKDLLQKIDHPKGTVGILGSRLSAIDAAIALAEHGYAGKMILFSRHKLLPAVRANKYATNVKPFKTLAISGYDLASVKKQLEQAVSHTHGASTSFEDWFVRLEEPQAFLRNELMESEHDRRVAWDTVLQDSNQIIEELWHRLPDSEKTIFMNRLKSKWLSFRVGIPKKNALKLLKLLESGQLSLQQMKGQPSYNPIHQQFSIESKESTPIEVDYLINATGSPLMVDEMASSLIHNLRSSGMVCPHAFGGIQVEFDTSKIIDADGKVMDDFYAIGQVTAGVYFFTSTLALNVKHAYHVAWQITRKITNENIYDKVGNL